MNTKTNNPLSTFKKSVLSIVVLSAVTGGLVLLEQYRSAQSNASFSEHLSRYNVPEQSEITLIETTHFLNDIEDNSVLTTDTDELAAIAEEHLITEVANANELIEDPSIDAIQPTESVINVNESENDVSDKRTVSTVDIKDSTTVLFDLSSSAISPEYKLVLSDMALQIKQQNKEKKWQIVGHTDKSGRAVYNLSLAKKRAQNVALFLIEQGVDENKLALVTLGEHEAKKLNNSTYNKTLRKVEVKQFDPELIVLAKKVVTDNEKVQLRLKNQQLRLQKQKIAALKETKVSTTMLDVNDDKNPLTGGIYLSESMNNTEIDNNIESGETDVLNQSLTSGKESEKNEVVINEQDDVNLQDDKSSQINSGNVTSVNQVEVNGSLSNEADHQYDAIKVSSNNTNNYVL